MSFRFRRIVRIAPGVCLNWGLGGPSLSVGPRGASATFGKRGTYANIGLPGTGISARKRIDGGRTEESSDDSPETLSIKVTVRLGDDGQAVFEDQDGDPLPTAIERQFKTEKKDMLRDWLQEGADEINVHLDDVLNLHLATPAPNKAPVFEVKEFSHKKPSPPDIPKVGFFTRKLRPKKRQQLEKEIERKETAYKAAMNAWGKLRDRHTQSEEHHVKRLTEGLRTDPEVMADVLQHQLDELQWPRETIIAFELDDTGKKVWLDVDLPEIEDMPTEQASVPARGFKVTRKTLSERKQRENYAQHIHSIVFRLAGEVFANLPISEEVCVSGYSQRPDKATGAIQDEYLLSVKIHRDKWQSINFDGLEYIGVVEALTRFDLRRKMTKTGIFTAIEPHSPND